MVVFWSIPSRGIRGHHLLADLQVGPSIDTVSSLLERASGIAGGIYAESQRERSHLLSNFRQSEHAQADMPVILKIISAPQAPIPPSRG